LGVAGKEKRDQTGTQEKGILEKKRGLGAKGIPPRPGEHGLGLHRKLHARGELGKGKEEGRRRGSIQSLVEEGGFDLIHSVVGHGWAWVGEKKGWGKGKKGPREGLEPSGEDALRKGVIPPPFRKEGKISTGSKKENG